MIYIYHGNGRLSVAVFFCLEVLRFKPAQSGGLVMVFSSRRILSDILFIYFLFFDFFV